MVKGAELSMRPGARMAWDCADPRATSVVPTLTRVSTMMKFKLSRRALLKTAGGGVAAALTIPVASKTRTNAHSSSERELSSDWQFRQAGEGAWLEATVPGTVHTDLLFNRRIPDPFYRTNERDLQWIDKKDWEYRKTIAITPET